jgi:hypothetical protein
LDVDLGVVVAMFLEITGVNLERVDEDLEVDVEEDLDVGVGLNVDVDLTEATVKALDVMDDEVFVVVTDEDLDVVVVLGVEATETLEVIFHGDSGVYRSADLAVNSTIGLDEDLYVDSDVDLERVDVIIDIGVVSGRPAQCTT